MVNAGIWFAVRRAAAVSALHWVGVAFTLIAAAVWLHTHAASDLYGDRHGGTEFDVIDYDIGLG